MENVVFQIILHGGNGRSAAMEAIQAAKQADFEEAKFKLTESAKALNEAHHIQTSLIQGEIKGEKTEATLLLIHAQDHLMNAMTLKDLAAEMVDLYHRIHVSERKT
ncbi:PTS lactose/cellobiose transporter subunit IIA [Bacillus salipaludis]